MFSDLIRLEVLLEYLRDVERRIPSSHEQPILEVARNALNEEIRVLSQSLRARDYFHPPRQRATA